MHEYTEDADHGPDYGCSDRTCDFSTYDLDDLTKCENCNKPFCPECLTRFPEGGFSLCRACCVCATPGCTEHALISCDECGALACGDHLLRHPTLNVCSLKCANGVKKEMVAA